MAHGLKEEWIGNSATSPKIKCINKKGQVKSVREGRRLNGSASRRIFSPQFKLKVLDSYRNDSDCRGNQRATARKYGIHRRQIQKWLQMETTLRCNVTDVTLVQNNNVSNNNNNNNNINNVAEEKNDNNTALNLVATSRQRGDDENCVAPSNSPTEQISLTTLANVQRISDATDDEYETCSNSSQDQALDFTCAALSKRRFFTITYKIEVLNAYYNDVECCGNQRATARKFGVHRRQIQKWLDHEQQLRAEVQSSPSNIDSECLDLSKKSTKSPSPCQCSECLNLPQETALCLVKKPDSPPDLYRPYELHSPEPPKFYDLPHQSYPPYPAQTFDCLPDCEQCNYHQYYPYYTYIPIPAPWLSSDYYKYPPKYYYTPPLYS